MGVMINNSEQTKIEKILKLLGKTSFDELETQRFNSALHGIRDLIELCGDDPTRDGVWETPLRVVKAYIEMTQGYREDVSSLFETKFEISEAMTKGNIVIVKDIPFRSLCEHHLLQFSGVAHIGYIPNGEVLGLSKFARVVDHFANRFQIQEQLTSQIAYSIMNNLHTNNVAVVLEAEHSCMSCRGVRKEGTTTITNHFSGSFSNGHNNLTYFMQQLKG
jgi:GTP cyclohydrolase IA